MTTSYTIENNTEKKEYFIDLKEYKPKIEYIKTTDKIFLTHTEVPTELEGKGIGSIMVKFALEDIDKQGLKLVPLCPFVAAYIKRHPEWRRLVLKGINFK